MAMNDFKRRTIIVFYLLYLDFINVIRCYETKFGITFRTYLREKSRVTRNLIMSKHGATYQ